MSGAARALGIALAVLVVLSFAASIAIHGHALYTFDREVHSEIDMAASSADAATMQQHLEEARAGLDEVGYGGGQYAYFLETPRTNTTVQREILQSYVDRAEYIEHAGNETAESVALMDLRKQLGADGEASSLRMNTYSEHLHDHPLFFLTGNPFVIAVLHPALAILSLSYLGSV